MYANKPKGVDLKEWAEKTNFEKIPEKARKKKPKKDSDDAEAVMEDFPAMDCGDQALTYANEYHRQVNFSGKDSCNK